MGDGFDRGEEDGIKKMRWNTLGMSVVAILGDEMSP